MDKKKARSKTTITKEILQKVEDLAEKGFNNILIGQSLNIATQTLSSNNGDLVFEPYYLTAEERIMLEK